MKILKALLFFVAYILLLPAPCSGGTSKRDSLMAELRNTINHRDYYLQNKEDTLNQLRDLLNNARDDDSRFLALGALLDEFRPYNTDSALEYCRRREELAVKTGRPDYAVNAALNTANVLSSIGMYKEALEITDTIPLSHIPDWLMPYYHYIGCNIYTSLAEYSLRPKDRELYRTLSKAHQDSIIALCEPGSISYAINVADRHNNLGEYQQAAEVLEDFLANSEYSTHSRAICAYTLSVAYQNLGEDEKAEEYMIIASIADLQAAVREYVSLRQLGLLLYTKGRVADAYDFLCISMEDARKCNARLRVLELNDIFPIVNEAYITAIQKEKSRQRRMIAIISLLSLFLLIAVWRIRKQMKNNTKAHREVKEANEKLKSLNDELREINSRLTEANSQIAESSHIKEEYIAQYMDQCSVFIEKFDGYRRALNKLVNSGKTEEMKRILKSTDFLDEELKLFYKNFDSTFLRLFPDFVERFNALLEKDEQIKLKKEGQLNTQLRIFALIRLGITDSIKIAQFLRYSVATIYNYRTQIRNKATCPRSEFEARVMKIS